MHECCSEARTNKHMHVTILMFNGFMLFIFQLTPAVNLWSIWTSPMTLQECSVSEGIFQATTASFSWGSSCAIDLSACHMRTRRRRKERGWTHFYTRETISWLYFSQDAKSIRNNKKMGSCKHLFSSFSSLLNQYDLCVNSCLLGVLGTAGTAAQLSVSLLPIVQSRKRKRCWWDKLQHQTRNFASKGFFSNKKDQNK